MPSVSAPILVGRRKGYYWFPTLMALADGALLVSAYDDLDAYSGTPMGLYSWSLDNGLTWTSTPQSAPFSECGTTLDSGEQLLLPYRLYPTVDGMAAPAALVPVGQQKIRVDDREVRVTGWPRIPQTQGNEAQGEVVTGGFSFNGQVVRLANSSYMTTLYGRFVGETRYSLVAVVSENGFDWVVRSIIADSNCPLPGGEGPCEAALTRLPDNRLMCVFRMDGNFDNVYDPESPLSAQPYGVAYSADEGATWTAPVQLGDSTGSVQPSLAILPDGMVALSGGRPGLFLWWNSGDFSQPWQRLDLWAHHNLHYPKELIESPINTSSYTEVLAISDSRLIVIYDRLPWGWKPIPREALASEDPADTNSLWAVFVDFSEEVS